MSELGDSYDYGDNYLDQDDLSDGGSETADTKVGADKRAHHNALERKRRDHIKDSFSSLRDSIPLLHGEKVNSHKASRAQILKKAAEYIDHMQKKNTDHKKDIELLRKENKYLEEKIKELEALKAANGQTVVKTTPSTSATSATIKTEPTTSSNKQLQCSAPSSSSSLSSSSAMSTTLMATTSSSSSSSPSVTVQTVIPAQVKVVTANGISKPIQLQGTLRMRRTSIGEPNGSGGISLLNNSHVRIKSESSSSASDANNSEYSEPKEPQVQILKSDHKVTTNTASGLIVTNRNGTTLLQQPIITLAGKPLVYKQQTSTTVTPLATTVTSVTPLASQANSAGSGNKNSLLGPPAKRKRIGESGVTIIAANVGQLLNK